MHKATILFNPNSGRRGKKRDAELNHAIGIIQSAGVRTELTVCRSSQEATDNARCAVADGSDTVFACGGDGTIHDVIQGLAGTPVALAILPFGTANALAHDLRIPLRPSAAAQVAVEGKSTVRRIPLGQIEYEDFNGKTVRALLHRRRRNRRRCASVLQTDRATQESLAAWPPTTSKPGSCGRRITCAASKSNTPTETATASKLCSPNFWR